MAWLIRLYEVFYFSALCKNAGECKKKKFAKNYHEIKYKHNDTGKRKYQLYKYTFPKCNIKANFKKFALISTTIWGFNLVKASKMILYFDGLCSLGNYYYC